MDPVTIGVLAGGMALQGLGSMYSANQQGKASDIQREAMRREIELGRNQSLINSQTMAPFTAAGYQGLQDVFGLSASGGVTSTPGAGGFNVPVLQSTGSKWDSPSTVGYQGFTKTGTGIDPTGGAGKYRDQLGTIDPNLANKVDATGDAERWMAALEGMGQNFKFNENDPAYKYKVDQATKKANQQLSARGMYNSRAGLNLLDESGRAIMADEYDKQYGREYQRLSDLFGMNMQTGGRNYDVAQQDWTRSYNQIMDLFNMSKTLGATEYNKGIDAIKIGQGSAASAGALGNQGVGQVNSALTGMASIAQQNANANSENIGGTIAGLGAMPINYMILQKMLSGGGGAGYQPIVTDDWLSYNTTL